MSLTTNGRCRTITIWPGSGSEAGILSRATVPSEMVGLATVGEWPDENASSHKMLHGCSDCRIGCHFKTAPILDGFALNGSKKETVTCRPKGSCMRRIATD